MRLEMKPNRGPHVARVDGQNRVWDQDRCPIAAPCRLSDENSRGKVQNVRGVIMAGRQAGVLVDKEHQVVARHPGVAERLHGVLQFVTD
jgi:hypothetical protein